MPTRADLRDRLLAARALHARSDAWSGFEIALTRELRRVVRQLEPQCLGLYWPQRSEFNAPGALVADEQQAKTALALPFALRATPSMHYRLWDGLPPALRDECGIPTSDGAAVVPDVVVVPCVGYTDSGHRLGYGGGYFDRWLAAHTGVCAIGVAGSEARVDEAELEPQAHDVRLTLIVTEHGPV